MDHQVFYSRLAVFAERAAAFAGPLLARRLSANAADQLIRSSSSAAANYRAAGQGLSHDDFTHKICVALIEADESVHWLQFLENIRCGQPEVADLLRDAKELAAMLGASKRTAKANQRLRRAKEAAERQRRKRDGDRPIGR